MKILTSSQNPVSFCLKVKQELPNQVATHFEEITPNKLRNCLFLNNGWRLSNLGYNFLTLYYQHYTCNSENLKLTGKIILGMDKAIKGPWFIQGKKLVIFDQTAHFELQMVGNNLDNFVNFKRI